MIWSDPTKTKLWSEEGMAFFCHYVQLLLDLRTVPTKKEVFCVVYDYAVKAELSKGY